MTIPNGTTHGTLEDVGKSVLLCDVCEEMFSKFDTRFEDGDPCPRCEENAEPPFECDAKEHGSHCDVRCVSALDMAVVADALLRAANEYRPR